jgi:hypothetical protein
MFSEQLNRILDLIKKTGDKVIIYRDSDPDNPVVLMGLDCYENFTDKELGQKKSPISKESSDLTESDLTDKINCDISAWKNQESSPYLAEESKPRNPWAIPNKIKDGAQNVE